MKPSLDGIMQTHDVISVQHPRSAWPSSCSDTQHLLHFSYAHNLVESFLLICIVLICNVLNVSQLTLFIWAAVVAQQLQHRGCCTVIYSNKVVCTSLMDVHSLGKGV